MFRTDKVEGIRFFTKPETLNLDAKRIQDLVDLSQATMEPPVTVRKSWEEVLGFIDHPLNLGDLPSHTQAVEAVIPLVSRVSTQVSDRSLREGAVRNIQSSRRLNPKINHKGSFKA
jgi:hypothetical protein